MPKPTAIDRAINDIKSKWREGKTLKQVADFYRIDSGNLERAFRNREGMTVKHFLDQKRKKEVTSALTKKPVLGYEIGTALGFANDLAFYRWVKRAFGVSFTELRLQIRNNSATRKRNKK